MKYIRTKDGNIFTVVEKIDKTEFNHSFKYLYRIKEIEKINNSSNIIVDVNVVKDADTIEELCDEFIAIPLLDADVEVAGLPIHVKKGTHYPVRRESIKKYIGTVKKGTSVLYGMIWIDDNLIKVAKMNEKGEFELL